MSTFEEKYRKKASVSGQAAVEGDAAYCAPAADAMEVLREAAKDEYKAYNSSAHPEFNLWVRTGPGNAFADVSIPYSYCNHMITDGSGFVISLHYSTPVICVTLHGRNLQDVWRKLLRHEVEWVMEFDPKKWDTPAEGEPCITGIEVTHKPLPGKTEDDAPPGEKKTAASTARH